MGPGAYKYTNSKGVDYYLHAKDVVLKNHREQRIYFFCRDTREGNIEEVPQGYVVTESERTGLPLLKKDR